MDTLIAIPVLFISVLMQITAISRLPLVHGTADLVMLTLVAWGIHSKTNNTWIWAWSVLAITHISPALNYNYWHLCDSIDDHDRVEF
jgi:hypothetical protein